MADNDRALQRGERVEALMRVTNLDRPEAEAAIAAADGEDIRDITGPDGRALTTAQRRRLGLGRTLTPIVHPVPSASKPRSQ